MKAKPEIRNLKVVIFNMGKKRLFNGYGSYLKCAWKTVRTFKGLENEKID